jgi:hypothetical protein
VLKANMTNMSSEELKKIENFCDLDCLEEEREEKI